MHLFVARVSPRLALLPLQGFSFPPLAGLGARESTPDLVFFLSGLAVFSAGLVVLRAARGAPQTVFRTVAATPPAAAAVPAKIYTAEEALAERELRASDRELLLGALAGAAETFYSIAGHLPREASDLALGKADDLRELVWLNRR